MERNQRKNLADCRWIKGIENVYRYAYARIKIFKRQFFNVGRDG